MIVVGDAEKSPQAPGMEGLGAFLVIGVNNSSLPTHKETCRASHCILWLYFPPNGNTRGRNFHYYVGFFVICLFSVWWKVQENEISAV